MRSAKRPCSCSMFIQTGKKGRLANHGMNYKQTRPLSSLWLVGIVSFVYCYKSLYNP